MSGLPKSLFEVLLPGENFNLNNHNGATLPVSQLEQGGATEVLLKREKG